MQTDLLNAHGGHDEWNATRSMEPEVTRNNEQHIQHSHRQFMSRTTYRVEAEANSVIDPLVGGQCAVSSLVT